LDLVYGDSYRSAAMLVRILTIGMCAASIRYALGDGLRGMGAHALATRAEVLGWVAGAVGLAVFMPLWGVNGVAVAVSVAYATTLAAMLGWLPRIGVSRRAALLPSTSDLRRALAIVRRKDEQADV
jgi:O-antigen/teichoic acid export membrane protein